MTDNFFATLPTNSRIQTVDYVPKPSLGADGKSNGSTSFKNVISLPAALAKVAIVSEATEAALVDAPADGASQTLTLLRIPAAELADEQALSRIRDWIDQPQQGQPLGDGQASLMLNLQHVQVFWSPQRIAVIAEGDRLETVCKSIIEVTYYVRELKTIEQSLIGWWPQLETDTPLAFEFSEQDRHKQKQLRQRFQEAISLRARLARVTPFLLAPHVYPPTLAAQVGERLRERVRVHEQVEFVSDQIEVFEDVYEMCGQRSSDFQQARTGHTLEWIIIILLAAEVILMAFDYLSLVGS